MGNFSAIDLAALPQPAAVVIPSAAGILSARLAYFATLWASAQANDPTLPNYDVETLETDPGVILQEADAYRETLVLSAINDAVLATSLAFAQNADLDVVAADYQTIRAPGELDPSLRRRAQLSWEVLSVGGSYGGYRYKALSAAPVDLSDVQVYGYNDAPGLVMGEVRIVCLGANASGIPSDSVLANVLAACSPSNRAYTRKLNDIVSVRAAQAVPYSIVAQLTVAQGASAATVLQTQLAALSTFLATRRVIGGLILPGDVQAILGLNAPGLVRGVSVTSPLAPVAGGPFQVPILSGVGVTWAYAS